MGTQIENIFQNFINDPSFEMGKPENERRETAWKLAWERTKQSQRNEAALSMAKEDIKKESVGTMGPDSGVSKYPAKIGSPTTIENTKKFGQEILDIHRDPNRAWRVRPATATERTGTKKELEKINPVAAAKKLFSKMEKEEMSENTKSPRYGKDFHIHDPKGASNPLSSGISHEHPSGQRSHGHKKYAKTGGVTQPSTFEKWELFKAFLKKHLTDTLDAEEPQENNADIEMAEEAEITLDTIIEALMELKERITQHEMDEETGQDAGGEVSGSPESGLEVLDSVEKSNTTKTPARLKPSKHPKPKIQPPWKPGSIPIAKHYTGPGGKHEHLETGQWVRPGMKTVPSKTTSGNVLAKKDPMFPLLRHLQYKPESDNLKPQDLDFKDQSAVRAEREMFAQGKLKKPVKKLDSRGKPSVLGDVIQGASSPVTKHEEDYIHGHGDKEKQYPFLSHLIPPSKIKTEPVKKENPRPEPLVRNPDGAYVRKPSPNRIWPPPVKKDTSNIAEVLDVQKKANSKVSSVFALATNAAKKQGFRDFSEGSPGKEKRGEIAEKIKEKEGISKAANINLSGENTKPGFTRNPISHRVVKRALGIRNPKKTIYNVLGRKKFSAPDGTPMTTGVTAPQLRVE